MFKKTRVNRHTEPLFDVMTKLLKFLHEKKAFYNLFLLLSVHFSGFFWYWETEKNSAKWLILILTFRGTSTGMPARCWERGPDVVTSNRFCSLIWGGGGDNDIISDLIPKLGLNRFTTKMP